MNMVFFACRTEAGNIAWQTNILSVFRKCTVKKSEQSQQSFVKA